MHNLLLAGGLLVFFLMYVSWFFGKFCASNGAEPAARYTEIVTDLVRLRTEYMELEDERDYLRAAVQVLLGENISALSPEQMAQVRDELLKGTSSGKWRN